MEVYKTETRKVIKRFLHHQLGFAGCIHALDAALSRFIPKMAPEDLPVLRTLILANNEIVMKEMERRADMARPGIDPSNRIGSATCILCGKAAEIFLSEFDERDKEPDLYRAECPKCGSYHFARTLAAMSIPPKERARAERSLRESMVPGTVPILGWRDDHIHLGWWQQKPTPGTQGD